MQHHCAQHYVELCSGERQRLSERAFESDLHSGFPRLLLRPCNHLRRGVDPADSSSRPNASLRHNRKRSRAATYIQYRLARLKFCQIEGLASKLLLSPQTKRTRAKGHSEKHNELNAP